MASEGIQTVHEQLKKWRRTDDVEKLRMRVSRAMRIAETVAYAEGSTNSERLKACQCMQQTARTYLKVIEADELLERIEALEEAQEQQSNMRRVA